MREGEQVGPAEMTAVQQPPMTGDSGLRWDANNIADSDLEELEDDESNSAKLFERSRIRALAGTFECLISCSCECEHYIQEILIESMAECG